MKFEKITSKSKEDPLIVRVAELISQSRSELRPTLPSIPPSFFIRNLTARERPTDRLDHYLIRSDDVDVGYFYLIHHKITDLDELGAVVYISPQFRNQGYARQTYKYICDLLPDHVTRLSTYYIQQEGEDENSMRQWLNGFGVNPVYTERVNISDLSKFDPQEVRSKSTQLSQSARNVGFDLVHVENGQFGEVEDFNYPEYLKMVGRIWNDMPKEDASWEEEVISEEIYNAFFDNVRELGGMVWSVVAIHRESGKPAGLTDIFIYSDSPKTVYQGDTGVDQSFRGNGLGRTLKYMMLDKILSDSRLDQPKHWITGNANSNSHMLKINEELNYKHCYSEYYYEIPRNVFEEYVIH